MKMKTSYKLTKKNDQGDELIIMLEVEDDIDGKFSQQEMTTRIQAETKAVQEALSLPDQKPRLLPCAPPKKETMLSSLTIPEFKEKRKEERKGEYKATDRQINMINTIVPKMNKTVDEICRENNVNSVQELTYTQVNKIKKEYDEFKKKQGFEL
jgi:hypothetical protein